MDIVRLLDTYRFAVIRDREAIRVLAFLQREGPQNEDTLARLANVPLPRLRNKLTDLFRSNFIITHRDKYLISDLADMVLTRTGISDVVSHELIETAQLHDEHKLILVSFVDEREDEPLEWRRFLSAAVRSLSRLTQYVQLEGNFAARHWFGAVAGLDPSAHELGAERLSHLIWSRQLEKKSAPNLQFETLLRFCNQAVVDRIASNNFLITGQHAPADDADPTVGLTFVRLFASAVSHYIDDGLAAATAGHGIHADAIQRLSEWARPFEQEYVVYFNPSWRDATETRDRGIIDVLVDTFSNRRDAQTTLPWWSPTTVPTESTNFDTSFIAALRALEHRVRNLSAIESSEAIHILDRLRNDLITRAQPSRDPFTDRSGGR